MKFLDSRILTLAALSLLLTGCDNKVDDIKAVPTPTSVVINNGEIKSGGPCAPLAPWGYPQYNPRQDANQFVCHDAYAVEYNPRSKTSMWVVQHITADNLNKKIAVNTNDFRPDPALKDEVAAQLIDYKNSGYEKAQLAAPEDFINSKKQTSQSFYLTNVIPVNPYTANDTWKRLNANVRQWAQDYGEVYVISGPVYLQGKSLGSIGRTSSGALVAESHKAYLGEVTKGSIEVPTHLFKVILAPKIKQVRAFIIPNQPTTSAYLPQFSVSMGAVQMYTGLNFFPQIPQPLKSQFENSVGQWPIR